MFNKILILKRNIFFIKKTFFFFSLIQKYHNCFFFRKKNVCDGLLIFLNAFYIVLLFLIFFSFLQEGKRESAGGRWQFLLAVKAFAFAANIFIAIFFLQISAHILKMILIFFSAQKFFICKIMVILLRFLSAVKQKLFKLIARNKPV